MMIKTRKIISCMVLITMLCSLLLSACGDKKAGGVPDVSGAPDRTVTDRPEPEISATTEQKPPSVFSATQGQSAIELFAETADLSSAPDIVLEPDAPPYNLGGWVNGNKVSWVFEISEEGYYSVGVEYSRPYTGTDVWGTINIFAEGEIEPEARVFNPAATTEDENNWTAYDYINAAEFYLEPGVYRVELVPGKDGFAFTESHFINLRGIYIVPEPAIEHDSAASITLADFEGRWYRYADDMWLIIEGDTYTMYTTGTTPDSWSTNSCKFENGALIAEGEVVKTMAISPEGTLTMDRRGHFRRQEGEAPGESPIDLSANSYLGEWYCAELDETIELRYNFKVWQVTRASDGGFLHSDGTFEPFGNRLVLSRSVTSGGEETLFNGGDAVYDPDSQTLTTAGMYVYDRVTYGGGLKLLPAKVEYYDWYDWSGPYISEYDIASDFIAVWQEYGEDVDPKFLDPDYLIEAIDNSDSEEELYFAIACEVAGVDVTGYFGFNDYNQ